VRGGAEAAEQWAERPTTAVVAYNDLMAIGLVRGLTEQGVTVPRDVSVVGFDNIFAADLVSPGPTTVAAPLHALGSTAARNLIALIGGATSRAGRPAVLPTRLVIRGTTAQRSRKRTSPA
jgi:LacI family transcriptional regulator